jgi:hypothetical protein
MNKGIVEKDSSFAGRTECLDAVSMISATKQAINVDKTLVDQEHSIASYTDTLANVGRAKPTPR